MNATLAYLPAANSPKSRLERLRTFFYAYQGIYQQLLSLRYPCADSKLDIKTL
ncbi:MULTISPECIES: hypothetical protein [Fischerella]|uniref:hypothetical protein n=1 Tax=Fischerella TaxID=1190 RepID=UPI0002FD07AF|nr:MULTISPECIES: hypothetical protein [Fischerella]MBF1989461.1 hypothetical protein [Fischerella thermalis M58_A2018_009]